VRLIARMRWQYPNDMRDPSEANAYLQLDTQRGSSQNSYQCRSKSRMSDGTTVGKRAGESHHLFTGQAGTLCRNAG